MREIDGAIAVWYHAHGAPPEWEIEPTTDRIHPLAHSSARIVNRVQDFLENGVDVGHFMPVHHTVVSNYRHSNSGPIFSAEMDSRSATQLSVFSGDSHLYLEWVGMFCIRGILSYHKPEMEARMWAFATPVDLDHIDITFAMTATRLGPLNLVELAKNPLIRPVVKFLSRLMVVAIVADSHRDIPIWENKVFLTRPKLAKGDGPIMEFRKWANQFEQESDPDGSIRHVSDRHRGGSRAADEAEVGSERPGFSPRDHSGHGGGR
ncbi:hypothetical protein [Nocardia sp. BMG51109]|uniref:hypothetical protein n=1 Tax=Nocardia sp. BMG51109 TaxID=1056816 RepID=UPI001E2FABA4|nr:hypothetical protein [Nocardia sp. BMG51109]